jgi:hypothetical protein
MMARSHDATDISVAQAFYYVVILIHMCSRASEMTLKLRHERCGATHTMAYDDAFSGARSVHAMLLHLAYVLFHTCAESQHTQSHDFKER